MRRAALLAGLLTVVFLVQAVAALGAPTTWTVCPSGCNYTDIQAAISNASTLNGDTIDILASGSPYVVTNVNHINTSKHLIIQGDPSGPRPVITDSTAADTPVTINIGSSTIPSIVRHLEIDATGSGSPTAVSLTGVAEGTQGPDGNPAALRDAIVNSTGVGVAVNAGLIQQAIVHATTGGVSSDLNGGFVYGSVVTTSTGSALVARKSNKVCTGSCNPPHDLEAINVDAISASGFGLEAQNTPDTTLNYAGTIASTNTIARGGAGDISGDAPSGGANPLAGQVFVDHSNFRTSTGITSTGAGNQNADPKFVNAGAGDFHLQPGSPAIAAGTVDEPGSSIDADGNPFIAPPEIGAYRAAHPANPQPNCSGAFVAPGLKANKKGVITVTSHFPCAGKLKVNATVKVKVKVKGKKKTKTKLVQYAKVTSISRNAAGLVVFKLKPTKKGKKLLKSARKKHHKLKVSVAFTFTPTTGTASKKTKTIKIK